MAPFHTGSLRHTISSGGDKSDGFVLGRLLPKPNDGLVGTRSGQGLKDDSPAIRSDVRGRYQTHETHSERFGYPTYFEPPFLDPTGELRSQSYQCIQNVLLECPIRVQGPALLHSPPEPFPSVLP